MNKDFAEFGLELASKLGASYADIRFVDGERRTVSVKNGKPNNLSQTSESGFGVRVIVNNGWGFAGAYVVSKEEIMEAVEMAVKLGKASATASRHEIELVPVKIVDDKYETPVKIEPMSIPIEEDIEILVTADKAYREMAPHVKSTTGRIFSRVEEKYLATSEGSRIEQRIVHCGGNGGGVVSESGLVQNRSWELNPQTRGYEYLKEYNIPDIARQAGLEAEQLLSAEPCPTEIKSDIILDDAHMHLQIHETIGHATELDRVLGTEADYAGMSFLNPEMLNNFTYGTEQVNFIADPTIPGGLGTYGYDDEGVPGHKVYIVKDGEFTGYQSSRETAAQIRLDMSSAGMRASAPNNLPLVRMNNICLEPGDWKAAEIIEDTKDGYIMRTSKMWSVDQRRLNFQFATEIGWHVKDGEVKEMIRDPTYTGISYDFWRGMDATAKDDWKLYGTTGCAKGRPIQGIYVGHGSATTRIRNVRIGITGRM